MKRLTENKSGERVYLVGESRLVQKPGDELSVAVPNPMLDVCQMLGLMSRRNLSYESIDVAAWVNAIEATGKLKQMFSTILQIVPTDTRQPSFDELYEQMPVELRARIFLDFFLINSTIITE